MSENGGTNQSNARKSSTIPSEYQDAQFSIKPGRQKGFNFSTNKDGSHTKNSHKGHQKTIDLRDGNDVSEYLVEILRDKKENEEISYEEQLVSLIVANKTIHSAANVVGALTDTRVNVPQTSHNNEKKVRSSYEEQTEQNKALLKKMVIPPKPKSTSTRGKGFQLSQPYILPKFRSWDQVQHSYKLVPELPEISNKCKYLDFIGNEEFKSFFIWGQSSKHVEVLPATMPEATLFMSQAIDLFSIDDTNTSREERKVTIEKPKNAEAMIKKISGERVEQRHRLKEMMDIDQENYYHLEDFSGALTCEIPPMPLDEMDLVFAVMNIVEMNADVMQTSGKSITRSLGKFIPFLKMALQHQDQEFHIICPSIHVAFFYYLSHAMNRIYEYLQRIDFIETHLAFEIARDVHSDRLFITNKEAAHFARSVEEGGYLSQPMRTVHCASVLHSTVANLSAYDNAMDFMSGKANKISSVGFDGIPLYSCRFEADGRFVNISVKPYNQRRFGTAVSPFYCPVMFKYPSEDVDDVDTILANRGLQFTVNKVVDQQIQSPFKFIPGTSSFVFM